MKKNKIFSHDNNNFLISIDIESFTSFYTATPYKRIKYNILKYIKNIGYIDFYNYNDSINYIDYTFNELFEKIKNEAIEKIEKLKRG